MSLSPWEQRTLSCIADRLADSAPELASLLSVFNRLASGEEMPEHWHAGNARRCERQRSRRNRRLTRPQRQAGHVGRRAWPVITALAFISVAMIVVALVLSLTVHDASGNGRCAQSWPIVCPGH